MKPTKFDLMRLNRSRAWDRGQAYGWAPLSQATEPAESFTAISFSLDGWRYIEQRDLSGTCNGCIFNVADDCERPDGYEELRDKVLGGGCSERHVIYIKAA